MKAYTIFLERHGRLEEIDTVFYTSSYNTRTERQEEVRRSLVNHDGYNPNIVVREEK